MKKIIQIGNSSYFSHLSESTIDEHMDELLRIQDTIIEKLKDYPNFYGMDFTDVNAGGIQIRGHHRNINGYSYGDQPTLKYDFSNIDECIEDFVEGWKRCDNPKDFITFKRFIEDGQKYGWD